MTHSILKPVQGFAIIFATLALCTPSTAQDARKSGVQKDNLKNSIVSKQITPPCVNPFAPCPGEPVVIDLQKLVNMDARDKEAYVRDRIQKNYADKPIIGADTAAEKMAVKILSSIQKLPEGAEGDSVGILSISDCCTVEFGIKIKFGKPKPKK
jgi:hypothetical protein